MTKAFKLGQHLRKASRVAIFWSAFSGDLIVKDARSRQSIEKAGVS
jgi:hypothetical protein